MVDPAGPRRTRKSARSPIPGDAAEWSRRSSGTGRQRGTSRVGQESTRTGRRVLAIADCKSAMLPPRVSRETFVAAYRPLQHHSEWPCLFVPPWVSLNSSVEQPKCGPAASDRALAVLPSPEQGVVLLLIHLIQLKYIFPALNRPPEPVVEVPPIGPRGVAAVVETDTFAEVEEPPPRLRDRACDLVVRRRKHHLVLGVPLITHQCRLSPT